MVDEISRLKDKELLKEQEIEQTKRNNQRLIDEHKKEFGLALENMIISQKNQIEDMVANLDTFKESSKLRQQDLQEKIIALDTAIDAIKAISSGMEKA